MLISAKLFAVLKFSALKLSFVKTTVAIGLSALAWGTADLAHIPSSGVAAGAHHQSTTVEKSAQRMHMHMHMHEEVQYIGDKFSEEQQELHHQASATLVQAF